MESKVTEIIIHYKAHNHFIFNPDQAKLAKNTLVIRLQPSESIALQVLTKEQGIDTGMLLRRDPLQLNLAQAQTNIRIPDAYERLLLEAIKGNQSLFVRRDEVELSWQWCDQVRRSWQSGNKSLAPYPVGSPGPQEALDMIQMYGHHWYEDCDEN